MPDFDDAFRIAESLPGTVIDRERRTISVMNKGRPRGFAWVWLERTDPDKTRAPNPSVIAIRVRDLAEKDLLLATNPGVLFTEPHYDGYPAVLARLAKIDQGRLELLITNAWRYRAPVEVVRGMEG